MSSHDGRYNHERDVIKADIANGYIHCVDSEILFASKQATFADSLLTYQKLIGNQAMYL